MMKTKSINQVYIRCDNPIQTNQIDNDIARLPNAAFGDSDVLCRALLRITILRFNSNKHYGVYSLPARESRML